MISPRCKYFVTVRTGIAVVLDALVDNLDVPVQMSLLTEHFMTFRTGCRFVYLDVEMNLREKKITMFVLRRLRR